MVREASDGVLLGLLLGILFGGIMPLEGVNPHIPSSSVSFRWWLYSSGTRNLFKLISGVVGVALLVWALVLRGLAVIGAN